MAQPCPRQHADCGWEESGGVAPGAGRELAEEAEADPWAEELSEEGTALWEVERGLEGD